MPNLPISGLPAATTPLTGAEILPLVQGGVTDRATVANVLAAVPAGTAALPGLAFSGDQTTGLYYVGAGSAGLSARALPAIVWSVPVSAVNYITVTASATGIATQIAATGSDTNIPLVLGPKGTGALQAQLTTSSSVGGNARGTNATDWQTSRGTAAQAATGATSVISGGGSNTASGAQSVVAGGTTNTASSANTTVGGGTVNTASATQATVAGGGNNTAGGVVSWVPGGSRATTRGIYGRGAWGSGRIAADGDAQSGEHPAFIQTTNATPARITADGGAASATNSFNLPNFAAYAGTLLVVAKQTGAANVAIWRLPVSILRGANAAATVMFEGTAATILPTSSSGTVTSWSIDLSADTTNGGINLTANGIAATTINWSARYMDVETTTAS